MSSSVTPEYQTSIRRILANRAIRSRYERTVAIAAARVLGRREAVSATRDDDARRQALDIPFPRGRKCLVEVVLIEHDVPFGRGVDAEVAQMRIAAGLDDDVGSRGR